MSSSQIDKSHVSATPTKDDTPKRSLSAYPYYLSLLVPLLSVFGIYLGGVGCFFGGIMAYVIGPALELVLQNDDYNPSKEECKRLDESYSFKVILFLWVPVQVAFSIYCAYAAAYFNYPWWALMGLVISIGASNSVGITVSHELMHKSNTMEQTMSQIILCCDLYMHFFIEHLQGHHKNVSTPYDPATSRYNESLYAFLPRCVYGTFMSAWHIECKRVERKGHSIWSIHNQMLWFLIIEVLSVMTVWCVFGTLGMVIHVAGAMMGVLNLEVVNFIEHYGLARKAKSGQTPTDVSTDNINIRDVFEKVSPMHSWNADYLSTNYFLFKLQRHSDHHSWPGRSYQTLRTVDYAPQFPAGYATMVVLALFPPLWRRVMNPRVERYNAVVNGEFSDVIGDDDNLLRARLEQAQRETTPVLTSSSTTMSRVMSSELFDSPKLSRSGSYSTVPAYDTNTWYGYARKHFDDAQVVAQPYISKLGGVVVYTGDVVGRVGRSLSARGPAYLLVRLGVHMVAYGRIMQGEKRA